MALRPYQGLLENAHVLAAQPKPYQDITYVDNNVNEYHILLIQKFNSFINTF